MLGADLSLFSQRLLKVEQENEMLKTKVDKLQRQNEELLFWLALPRKHVELDLDDKMIQELRIAGDCIRPSAKRWVQVCSRDQLLPVGRYTISMTTLLEDEQAQTILGVVTEDLRKEHNGFWSKEGAVLLNNHCQRALIYEHGSYVDPKIAIPKDSTITMLLDWNERSVSWYLNREIKLGKRQLPAGRLYASYTFFGRSYNCRQ